MPGRWQDSIAVLEEKLRRDGPYDGVMGFSQGAAMALLWCLRRQQQGEGACCGVCRQQQGEGACRLCLRGSFLSEQAVPQVSGLRGQVMCWVSHPQLGRLKVFVRPMS